MPQSLTESKSLHAINGSSTIELEIVGELKKVESCRIQCLTLIDELFGMNVDCIIIESIKHAILFGKKRKALNDIITMTNTQIYVPFAFKMVDNDSTIYITGRPENIKQAKESIEKLVNAASPLITKIVVCSPKKIDYIHINMQEKLCKMMTDNACTIILPPICSNLNTIKIVGVDQAFINRCTRALMRLVCEIYVGSLQLQIGDTSESWLKIVNEINPVLAKISGNTGAEFICQKNIIDLVGSPESTKKAYEAIVQLDFIKNNIRDTKFSIELGTEYREFINGKKNGKINKIVKLCNCRIVFHENEGINMTIDIYSPIPSKLLQGIQLLEDELPAESSFHIPESFHKRIIGVAGKNIQKIMKKYGVYVKFSNSQEFLTVGGYYENDDNVIARTPAKNAENLANLKDVICESVNALELLEEICHVSIPRIFHRYIFNQEYILEMHKKNFNVIFPACELAIDLIILEGNVGTVQKAREDLLELIPKIYGFSIPANNQTHIALTDPEFIDLTTKLQLETKINLHFFNPNFESLTEYEYPFYLVHQNLSNQIILDYKTSLFNYFAEKKISTTSLVTRQGSYANLTTPTLTFDSFQHFNSKLLAGDSNSQIPVSFVMRPSFGLFGGKERVTSTPSLREIFDSDINVGLAPPGLKRSGSALPESVGGTSANAAEFHPNVKISYK
jgi:hypothetical protein